MKHFRHRQHEVIVFHVLDDLERSFDFRDEARFVDLETQQEIRSQPWFVKTGIPTTGRSVEPGLGAPCREQFIDYVPMTTSTPFDRALLAYLNKRSLLG